MTLPAMDEDRVERIAQDIIEQIIDMMDRGYDVGRGRRYLPMVPCYGALHDYFDANVAWGAEWDWLCEQAFTANDMSEVNAVTDRVDQVLRLAAGTPPTYALADFYGLVLVDPYYGETVMSRRGGGGYFDLLRQSGEDGLPPDVRSVADQVLARRGHPRIGQWEVDVDDLTHMRWRAQVKP